MCGGAFCTKDGVLSADLAGLVLSDADLSADSIRSAFSLMSQSFLVQDLIPLQILHLSHT